MIEPNSIINGNCLVVMEEIEDESIDMILCDPPYGSTQNNWDIVIPPDKMWEQYKRIIKENGAILIFGQGMFTAKMIMSNPEMFRYNIIWDKVLKSGFLNANRMPLRQHEDIMVFYKKAPTYNPQLTHGSPNHSKGSADGRNSNEIHSNRNYGNYVVKDSTGDMKYPSSIWTFQRTHPRSAIHATEKPVSLLRYAIRTYTNPGELVLDNCCGSGSTLIAAKAERRYYIGIDNGICDKKSSPYYGLPWVEVAKRRLMKIDEENLENFENND